ncbi:MAG: hypothetical protein LUD17_11875 [Bacteroidales bacterium]|nr:hypothetical protein [Bacteroidales bacterium]
MLRFVQFDPWLENEDMIIRVNTLIVLCSRTLKMLRSQMESRLNGFKQSGGFTENMTQERLTAIKTQNQTEGAPTCQLCGAVMVKRTAKKGARAGTQFWSCSNYHTTGCNYIINIP